MSLLSKAAWLQTLEQRHPSAIDMGLERVGAVADRLNARQFVTFPDQCSTRTCRFTAYINDSGARERHCKRGLDCDFGLKVLAAV